jgi:hypothetical protein
MNIMPGPLEINNSAGESIKTPLKSVGQATSSGESKYRVDRIKISGESPPLKHIYNPITGLKVRPTPSWSYKVGAHSQEWEGTRPCEFELPFSKSSFHAGI